MPRCAHDACQRWRPAFLAAGAVSFDGEWFCHARCLRDATAARLRGFAPQPAAPAPPARFKLGTLLLAARAVTPEVLERALERQRSSGRPLGAELVAMGAIDTPTLTHALARQAGVPTLTGLTTAHVHAGIGGLSRAVVRALGIVPFQFDELAGYRVAVTTPIPRTAIRALERMTGNRVRPYLVADATLASLLEAYGAAAMDGDGTLLASPVEAAAHIAASARAGQAEAWRCVPATTFTWVRLHGAHGTDDLIVTSTGQEDRWQAAPTRH